MSSQLPPEFFGEMVVVEPMTHALTVQRFLFGSSGGLEKFNDIRIQLNAYRDPGENGTCGA